MTPTKICRTCEAMKSLDEFPTFYDRSADRRRVMVNCRPCHNSIRRAAYERQDWTDRFLARVVLDGDGCWEWQGRRNKMGYGEMEIKGRLWRVHRLSFALHYGDLPTGCFVCHHCDNPSCARPDHLYAGDAASNNRDAQERGRSRYPVGEDAGSSKLTTRHVIEIRDAYASGRVAKTDLANKYGVSASQIWSIVNFQAWKHVA